METADAQTFGSGCKFKRLHAIGELLLAKRASFHYERTGRSAYKLKHCMDLQQVQSEDLNTFLL